MEDVNVDRFLFLFYSISIDSYILKHVKLTDSPKQKRKATAGDMHRAMSG